MKKQDGVIPVSGGFLHEAWLEDTLSSRLLASIARQGKRGADRYRLLAGRLHVEAGLALTLGAEHPLVKRAGQRHVAEHRAQLIRRDQRGRDADELRVPAGGCQTVWG